MSNTGGFRITVINEFRNATAFVSYRRYGELEIWDASCSRGPAPSYLTGFERVHIFDRRGEQHCMAKGYDEARAYILRLIAQAPVDLTEYTDRLMLALEG